MRKSFIYLLIAVATMAIFFTLLADPMGGSKELAISKVTAMAKRGEVESIEVRGDKLTIKTTKGEIFTSNKEAGASVMEMLRDVEVNVSTAGLEVDVKSSSGIGNLFGILFNFLPLIFFGAILLFMMRQAQGGANQTFRFGKSRARMFVGDSPTVSFSDVAGVEEAKEETARGGRVSAISRTIPNPWGTHT